ncbi:MAG: pyridoxamine 5'-phosphate oxidase family protein [Chloroflexi bacterium]|nr:pyridoxamine 5'-phosphate oxidase family protein [Chloroflexota bacterium]
MRRQDKAILDPAIAADVLLRMPVGYLALADDDGPFTMPINFVYVPDERCVYFHSAGAGRKVQAFTGNPRVGLTVCEHLGTVAHWVPGSVGMAYRSVMIRGQIRPVTDLAEETRILQLILDKYVPGFFQRPLSPRYVDRYRSRLGSRVLVLAIDVAEIAAKQDLPNGKPFFTPGMTIRDLAVPHLKTPRIPRQPSADE